MAEPSRYQPTATITAWCGTRAYWEYPPNPMYTYGEPEALQRPMTPTNDFPVGEMTNVNQTAKMIMVTPQLIATR